MIHNGAQNGHHSPVAIIGGGLGGLSAAIHLRLAGREVIVFEANDRVGGRASQIVRDGFRFDTGPSLLNYPWVFEELFQAAGRELKDYVTLLPVDPSITFQWLDGTAFRLSSNLQILLAECERLEPHSRPAVFAFLRDAAIKYRRSFDKLVSSNEDNPLRWLGTLSAGEMARLAVWRSLDSELGRFFKSRYIREAFGAYAMYLGGSPYNLPGLFSILSYGELAYGLWLPKGGIYGLVEGIVKLAQELGVQIRTACRIRRIIIDERRVTGVELADGQIFKTATVVSNVDLPTTNTELIDEPSLVSHLRPKAARTRMTPGVLTFYWGIRGRVSGLGHHTIFLPNDYRCAFDDLFKRKRLPRDLPFYVAAPSETDRDLAPPGETAMFVLVPTPLLRELGQIDWGRMAGEIKQQVIERMRHHNVDFDAQRIMVEEILTPEDWRARFGLYEGSAFGAAHTFLQVGPFRARNYSSDIAGLYYVGASTTPGTGMPMVILGGKMTAARIASHNR